MNSSIVDNNFLCVPLSQLYTIDNDRLRRRTTAAVRLSYNHNSSNANYSRFFFE